MGGKGKGRGKYGGLPPGVAAGLVGGVVVGGALATAAAIATRPLPARPKPKPVAIVVVDNQTGAPSVVVSATRKGKGKGKIGPLLNVLSIEIPCSHVALDGNVTFFAVDVYPYGGGAPWRVMRRYNDFHGLHQRLAHADDWDSVCGASFPRKHLTSCTGAKLEARRAGLEIWLQKMLMYCDANLVSRRDWIKQLNGFLEAWPAKIKVSTAAKSAPLLRSKWVPKATQHAQPAKPAELNPKDRHNLDALRTPPQPAQPAQPPQCPRPPQPAHPAKPTEPMPQDRHNLDNLQMPRQPPQHVEPEVLWMQVEVPAGCVSGQQLGVKVPDGRQLIVVIPQGVAAGAILDMEFNSETGALVYLPPEPANEDIETSNGLVLEVQVPFGVISGQLISVPCPNDQNVTVAVPPNIMPGGVIQLIFDQAKGTLAPLT